MMRGPHHTTSEEARRAHQRACWERLWGWLLGPTPAVELPQNEQRPSVQADALKEQRDEPSNHAA
jgi:hypothetical protein